MEHCCLAFCCCHFFVLCVAAVVVKPPPFVGLGSVQFSGALKCFILLSTGRVEAVRDMPTHMQGKGCADAASPGSPFGCLGVGCLWQTESWLEPAWELLPRACKVGGGSSVTKQDSSGAVVKEDSIPSMKIYPIPLPGGQSCHQQSDCQFPLDPPALWHLTRGAGRPEGL